MILGITGIKRSRIRLFQGIIILTMKNMKGLKNFYFINFMSFMVIFQTVAEGQIRNVPGHIPTGSNKLNQDYHDFCDYLDF